jgi:acetyl esterase/lipase
MRITALLFLCGLAAAGAEPEFVLLWPGGAPGSPAGAWEPAVRVTPQGERVVSGVHKPAVTVYLPEKGAATGTAVVIAPGGGHRELWSDHEGHNVARWLAARGVAGLVLHYRLAREKDSAYKIEEHSLADTQRAIRLARARAGEWGIRKDRVGVMGFSAGGELAALAAVRMAPGNEQAVDAVEKESGRPDFQALIYPAIPREMPLEKSTPAAFLACGENDRQNISQGLPELYIAMKKAGASAELHVYAGVGHGFGLRPAMKGPVAGWVERFHEWLRARGMLER